MLLWDGFGLQSTHSGIGRHALELAFELDRIGRPPSILPSVASLDPAFEKWRADLRSFPLGRVKALSLIASGLQAKTLLRRIQPSSSAIYHGLSNYNLPALPKTIGKVLTVHDLIPLVFPEGVSKSLHRYLVHQLPKALGRADLILCVSEWTACSVKNQFPFVKDRVFVLPNGRAELRPRQKTPAGAKVRLLTVSRGEKYKRLSLIPDLFDKLGPDFDWQVLTDSKGTAQLANNPRLVLHQGISDETLENLWQTTDIFVHPSLWEGYCLPAAKALSYGIPTVYTGGSGIDEVSGTAGVRLPTGATLDDWASAIIDVSRQLETFEKDTLTQWKTLVSWPEVAQKLLSYYDSIRS